MINKVLGANGISVTGSFGGPYIGPGNQSAGMMRYNTSTQNVEVYDGNSWLSMTSSPLISLDAEASAAIAWARKKMEQESNLESLMSKYPGLKDAYEKFEIMKALCQEENENVAG